MKILYPRQGIRANPSQRRWVSAQIHKKAPKGACGGRNRPPEALEQMGEEQRNRVDQASKETRCLDTFCGD